MNKKLLAILVAISCFSGADALASRAKLLVMGTGDGGFFLDENGNGGSFYYMTPYDMFYNPAMVNDYSSWAIIEKSNYTETSFGRDAVKNETGTATVGTTAQGGFVMSFMKFHASLFFNRVASLDDFYTNRSNMRPVDITIGSETRDIKWGLGATYGNFHGNKVTQTGTSADKGTDQDLMLRAGFEYRDFQPFFGYKVLGREGTNEPRHGYRRWQVGMRYVYGEWMPVALYRWNRAANRTNRTWGLALGRAMRVAEGIKLYYSVGYWARGGSRRRLPLDVSAEGSVTKWLTLRAGFGFGLYDRDQGNSVADNTTGRLGASIGVGGVAFDWAVGKSAGTAEGTGSTAAANVSDVDAQNFDFSNGLFTAASLSYKW